MKPRQAMLISVINVHMAGSRGGGGSPKALKVPYFDIKVLYSPPPNQNPAVPLSLDNISATRVTASTCLANVDVYRAYSANTRRLHTAVLMLGQRLRRWANISQRCANASCLLGSINIGL